MALCLFDDGCGGYDEFIRCGGYGGYSRYTFFGALYTHAHVRALVRCVRTCVWKKCGVYLLYLLYLWSCSYKVKGAGGKKFSACFLFERIFFVAL